MRSQIKDFYTWQNHWKIGFFTDCHKFSLFKISGYFILIYFISLDQSSSAANLTFFMHQEVPVECIEV
jgi:hypothetical protein